MHSYRKEKISIRFANLSGKLLKELKREFQDLPIITNENRVKSKGGELVAVLEMKDSRSSENLFRFVRRHKISKEGLSIRASLVTDQDSSGLLVPQHAVKLSYRIGCPLNFSFTIV
jgi:23S rRNA C2498 (ribose-2'-O)-methylase RlmM